MIFLSLTIVMRKIYPLEGWFWIVKVYYLIYIIIYWNNRRKFRSQTSYNMDRWKAEQGRGREKRKIRRKKSKKKEDADAWKGRKVAKHCVFPMIWDSGGSKSRLAKAAGAEPAGQRRDEKLHAVVARSTLPSQNVKNTRGADHFGHLRCRKSARRCGAKHISKWKCTKHTSFGPLFEVEMSEKCTPLWREAHFQVKMYKAHHFWKLRCRKSARRCGAKHISKSKYTKHTMYGPFLEVQMLFHVAGARDCGPCQKWAKREGFVAFSTTTTITLHHTTLQYIYTTLQPQLQLHLLHSTKLHSTTLHCTQLHSITLHYTTCTLQYATLHYTTLHYTTLHYTTLHYATLPSTTLHYTTLHYTTLHYITLHWTPLHWTPLHYNYTTLHSTTIHYTTLNYTTLHYIPLPSNTLHNTALHYTTLHSTTLHYTTFHYLRLPSTTLHSTPFHSTTLHWMTLHHR